MIPTTMRGRFLSSFGTDIIIAPPDPTAAAVYHHH
jgi:hypothetical protein